jgi:hypothetical protein
VITEQTSSASKGNQLILEETYDFKNYKINTGEGLKYFLGEGTKVTK